MRVMVDLQAPILLMLGCIYAGAALLAIAVHQQSLQCGPGVQIVAITY